MKRFIDVEYSIPVPETKAFCGYLLDDFGFENFFSDQKLCKKDELIVLLSFLVKKQNLTLRVQEKFISQVRLILMLFEDRKYPYAYLVVILNYLKIYESTLYSTIREPHNFNQLNNLQSLISNIFISVEGKFRENIICAIAYLTAIYNNSNSKPMNLFEIDPTTQKNVCALIIELDKHSSLFPKYLDSVFYDGISVHWEDILNKIDLSENIKMN